MHKLPCNSNADIPGPLSNHIFDTLWKRAASINRNHLVNLHSPLSIFFFIWSNLQEIQLKISYDIFAYLIFHRCLDFFISSARIEVVVEACLAVIRVIEGGNHITISDKKERDVLM